MESRKPEVIVDPTAAQLEEIGARTGLTLPPSTPGVAVARDQGGVYQLTAAPSAQTCEVSEVSETQETVSPARPQPTEGAGGEELIAELSRPQLLRVGAPSSLPGPPDSYYGCVRYYFPFNGTIACLPGERWNSPLTDKCQGRSSGVLHEFHVYWADGERTPFYVVIHKQICTFSPGSMVTESDAARGFGQWLASTEVTRMRVDSGSIRLVAHSPGSGRDAVRAEIEASMLMSQAATGGRAVLEARVADQTDLSLPEWSVFNQTDLPNSKWVFQQTNTLDGWDAGPLIANHFTGTKPADQKVNPFKTLCKSTFVVTTYAKWHVEGATRPWLSFGLELHQAFMVLGVHWTRQGGARGGDIIFHGLAGDYGLDLAAIAKAPV